MSPHSAFVPLTAAAAWDARSIPRNSGLLLSRRSNVSMCQGQLKCLGEFAVGRSRGSAAGLLCCREALISVFGMLCVQLKYF